jgi:hypothetical protein
MLYLAFYLVALDRNGIQLYIILTPRTHGCGAVYMGILGLYWLLRQGWNAVAAALLAA